MSRRKHRSGGSHPPCAERVAPSRSRNSPRCGLLPAGRTTPGMRAEQFQYVASRNPPCRGMHGRFPELLSRIAGH